MPASVKLTITNGPSQGQEFLFDERTTCIVGRSVECAPRLPTDEHHRAISRHHCLLDINPPDIRVRDFGSKNGTHVNGRAIGRRPKGKSAAEGAKLSFPECDLADGDEITLGKTVFRVDIFVPLVCVECSLEIDDEQERALAGLAGASFVCRDCRRKQAQAIQRQAAAAIAGIKRKCAECGRDVSGEVGQGRAGEYICRACRAEPARIMQRLLSLAHTGRKDLIAIRGYVIERELDRGGMGAVYLARHEESGERVALKIMLPTVAADERSIARFLRESDNTKTICHKHVVRLRDAGCCDGVFFFTMEFCDSGNVLNRMQDLKRKLTIAEAAPLILQTLEGLAYAHNAVIPNVHTRDGHFKTGKGLVHRDLKPQNIFLASDTRTVVAKVGDFGLAKAFDLAGLSGLTRTGEAGGTPRFMARAQVLNFLCAQPEVDVWAAAATFYFMLTGSVPREFDQGKDDWQTILTCDAVPIRRRDASLPKRLAEVIDRALIEKPRIGFSTAAELKRALEAAL